MDCMLVLLNGDRKTASQLVSVDNILIFHFIV